MVDALHAAGFEVMLDVVFNHTAEGGPAGPTSVIADSTTRPTTASIRTIRVATSTRPGAETR